MFAATQYALDIHRRSVILSSVVTLNPEKERIMPKTLGGLFAFAITSILTVAVGMWLINRIPPLRNFLNGQKAA